MVRVVLPGASPVEATETVNEIVTTDEQIEGSQPRTTRAVTITEAELPSRNDNSNNSRDGDVHVSQRGRVGAVEAAVEAGTSASSAGAGCGTANGGAKRPAAQLPELRHPAPQNNFGKGVMLDRRSFPYNEQQQSSMSPQSSASAVPGQVASPKATTPALQRNTLRGTSSTGGGSDSAVPRPKALSRPADRIVSYSDSAHDKRTADSPTSFGSDNDSTGSSPIFQENDDRSSTGDDNEARSFLSEPNDGGRDHNMLEARSQDSAGGKSSGGSSNGSGHGVAAARFAAFSSKMKSRGREQIVSMRKANAKRKVEKAMRASEQMRWSTFNDPNVLIEMLQAEGDKSDYSARPTAGPWPHEAPSAAAMASLGFYFSPKPDVDDRTICSFCGIKMFAWARDDDPVAEHARQSPHCLREVGSTRRSSISDNVPKAKKDRSFRRSLSSKESSSLSPGSFKAHARSLGERFGHNRGSLAPGAKPATADKMNRNELADLPVVTILESSADFAGTTAQPALEIVNSSAPSVAASAPASVSQYSSPHVYSQEDIKSISKVQAIWRQRRIPKPARIRELAFVLCRAMRRGTAMRRRKILLKQANRRKHIAAELFQTEKSYVQMLRALIQCYLIPLRAQQGKDAILSSGEIQIMFSNVEMLLGINSTLLETLEKRVTKWFPLQKVGDLFSGSNAHTFKLYTAYINNHDSAHQLWEKKMKPGKRFFKFATQAREDSERNPGHLELEQLLIVPVQRLPRYMLLLEDLLHITWPTHPDAPHLEEAVQTIRELNRLVDARRGDFADTEKMVDLRARLSGPGAADLCQPHRRLLAELTADIWLRDVSQWQSRQLILCNDLVLVAAPVKQRKILSRDFRDAMTHKHRIEHQKTIAEARFIDGVEYQQLCEAGKGAGADARPPAWGMGRGSLVDDPTTTAFVFWPKDARTSSDVLWFRVSREHAAELLAWVEAARSAVESAREHATKLHRIRAAGSSRFLT